MVKERVKNVIEKNVDIIKNDKPNIKLNC